MNQHCFLQLWCLPVEWPPQEAHRQCVAFTGSGPFLREVVLCVVFTGFGPFLREVVLCVVFSGLGPFLREVVLCVVFSGFGPFLGNDLLYAVSSGFVDICWLQRLLVVEFLFFAHC